MGEKGVQIVSALGMVLDVWGASSESGTNVDAYKCNGTAARVWRFVAAATPSRIGYQNDSRFFQVSSWNVWVPGSGTFGYATPSRIAIEATREDCIEAMIQRAMEYLGTPYRWDYSCAPGVGVDCAGLVMQALYATEMDLGFHPLRPLLRPWSRPLCERHVVHGQVHARGLGRSSARRPHLLARTHRDLSGQRSDHRGCALCRGVRIASVYAWSDQKGIRGVLSSFN